MSTTEGLQVPVIVFADVVGKVGTAPPAQIVEGDAVAVTFGKELTETVTLTVFEHPLEFVPVTE